MKLFYLPSACSLSPHIVLREAGLAFELDRIDLATRRTEGGEDYRRINPMGYVPALRLDDGQVLTEGAAIVQYIADAYPDRNLAPRPGTVERARVQAWLNFIAAELHKAFTPLFRPDVTDEGRAVAIAEVGRRFDVIEAELSDGRPYLVGGDFGVADAYLFVVARWAIPRGVGLDGWPRLKALVERIGERPTVQVALAAEAA
ncbi:glutathione transferase GstA [Caulobacter mirabilis]|uniref:Glutathione transferase GstA n=1 Tax=Caulobacter mirabilis TaxID=69666 RepID=A0A2D2B0C4_9CAUL|nr:glutathione transferase GstA [Caulobacter mirabilis]ATQ43637.1 glutathione transferase GstA [Caulobacter mirabilis]